MNTSERIWQIIKAAGVDTVFYLPGGGASYLVDALGQSGLKAVSMLHEQGAGYAAIGYAQQRSLGVVLVTSGPGASNAITPCLAAWMDSVPLVIISGQVPVAQTAPAGMRCKGVQEAAITDIVMPITKMALWSTNSEEAVMDITEAIKLAREGRMGPCWVDVPQDVQGAAYDL